MAVKAKLMCQYDLPSGALDDAALHYGWTSKDAFIIHMSAGHFLEHAACSCVCQLHLLPFIQH